METTVALNSRAEKKALQCIEKYTFCKSINLKSIKETLKDMLNHIGDNGMFIEYTMHDISHVNGMLKLLDIIIPESTKKTMTPADWLMIVLAVYFHDLGMFIPNEEYDNRQGNSGFISTKEKMLENDEIKKYVDSLDGDKGEKFLYQEYVRKNHGERICDWICNCDKKPEEHCKMISEMLTGLDSKFRSDLALICKSHQLDELPEHLNSVDEAYGPDDKEKVNLLYISVLLRSADVLHVTHDRAPEVEYRIILPQNRISIVEWAKQKEVHNVAIHLERDKSGNVDPNILPHSFEIQANFTDDKGYFSFMSYVDYAVAELKRCNRWCEASRKSNSNKYLFPWTDIDTSRVLAEGFSKDKLRFEIDQQNILMLLTGHTLYNDSTVVLRELIQNAMDAGKLQEKKTKETTKYQCKIKIEWDSTNRVLRVADNATGMDTYTIQNFLLKVGASKYQSEAFKKKYPEFHSISRFGIGLLTCFMISDDIDVYTLDEEEKQCHLLKIRNLNGEYLMRNDADVSHILEKEHGTTFELKVRQDIKMEDIEQQIRQWIIIPFGEVTLSIDGTSPIIIGYKSVREAVEDYAKNQMGLDFKTNKYRVYTHSRNGIDCAFLQYFNSATRVWSLYYSKSNRIYNYTLNGISIEGIKVRSSITPYGGFHYDGDYFAVINCVGEKSPTTNVARNDLEGGIALEEMYKSIFEMFFDSCVSQLSDLCGNNSLTRATIVINYMIDSLYSSLSYGLYYGENSLYKVLEDVKCIPIDNGKEIKLVSLNTIPDKVYIIDSQAFNSAVYLLQDVNVTDKTAYGLLSELDNHEINDENILLDNSIARCVFDLFLKNYEVVAIEADENHRRIQFTWAKKKKEEWIHVELDKYSAFKHVFVLKNAKYINVIGMGEKAYILSKNCLFVVKESPLHDYLLRLNNDLKEDKTKFGGVCEMIFKKILNDNEILDEDKMDQHITRVMIGEGHVEDTNYIEDVKKALKGYYSSVLNIRKYFLHDL